MWCEQKIEKHLKELINSEFEGPESEEFISMYTGARSYVIKEIVKNIKGEEPSLTDHSADHIANVMDKAWDLIEDQRGRFSAIEVYLLCLIILFHDVGNIDGREDHNRKVADVYNAVRSNNTNYNQERRLLLLANGAHCGTTRKGSRDTLSELDEISNLYNKQVKLRELASILRFADELSEGPQRTTQYKNARSKIDEDAKIYHEYASITTIHVDKGNSRIALTYNIDFDTTKDIKELLEFTYKRIWKLDGERRYCKYYAPILEKIKKTEAKINFTIKGNLCGLDLPKIELRDKYNLIEDDDEFISHYINTNPSFDIENIIETLKKDCNE